MKKSLLSILVVLAGTTCYAAVGDTVVLDGITYTATSATEAEVSDADNTVKTAVIPETVEIGGDNLTVTAIGEEAFYYSKITSVELPNSVTEIKKMGFYNCPLAQIKWSTELKNIGRYAFGYTKLGPIALPEGLEFIDDSAFNRCDNMTSVEFPSTLKEIGPSCFYKVPLTEVVLPAGLEVLGDKAFLNCANLAKVTLNQGLLSIGTGTFYGTVLTSIDIPASVKTIGDEAFYNVPLSQITIGPNIESIGAGAFSGTNLTTFNVDPANKNFTVLDDVLYNADKTLLVVFPAKCTKTELTLPAECIGICGEAFDRTGIQKVTVGNKFRAIDGFAFCQSKLSEINMPESLVFIGEQAFAGTNLTNVVLPKALPMIQEAVFAECKALSSVTIPASVTYVGIRAFWNCSSLISVNCEGMTPPELEDWYEAYESPFYQIPSSAVCNIPVGAAAAYKASAWKSEFSNFNESLAAHVLPTAYDPAEDSKIGSFDGITMEFASDMTIVNNSPAVKVIEGQLVAGVPIGTTISVDEWRLVADSKTELRLWPADYDGFTAPFNMEMGKEYFVIIPEGICKDAAGALNEAITIRYQGSYEAPKVEITSISPADGDIIDQIGTLSFTFAEKVNLQNSKLSDIKVMKGSVDGTEIPVEKWWAVNGTTSGTSISIFAGDEYDGYSMPVALEDGVDYYVIIPAALFRLAASYNAANEQIVLHYNNGKSGIDNIEAETDAPVEFYNLQGVRVENPSAGLYIRRQGNKATKVYVK